MFNEQKCLRRTDLCDSIKTFDHMSAVSWGKRHNPLQHINANAHQQARQIHLRSNGCGDLLKHLNWLSRLCTVKVGPNSSIVVPVNVAVRLSETLGNASASRVHAVRLRWRRIRLLVLLMVIHITSAEEIKGIRLGICERPSELRSLPWVAPLRIIDRVQLILAARMVHLIHHLRRLEGER